MAVATRSLKRRKLRRAKTRGGDAPASSDGASSEAAPSAAMPSVDQQLVVETLCTSSWVDVVWQDGSTEMGISSRDLYPVHPLDDKEVCRLAIGRDRVEISRDHALSSDYLGLFVLQPNEVKAS